MIIVRAKVGAAGRIVQRTQLTTHQVVIDLATLIFVQSGQKRIRWAEGDCVAHPGDAIALSGDRFTNMLRTPDEASLRAFAEITAANELDVVRHNATIAAQHGQELLKLFSGSRAHLSVAAWRAWANEPLT